MALARVLSSFSSKGHARGGKAPIMLEAAITEALHTDMTENKQKLPSLTASLMKSAVDMLLEELEVPVLFAQLEDEHTYNPSNAETLERKAKAFERRLPALLETWKFLLQVWNKDSTEESSPILASSILASSIFMCGAHLCDSAWRSEKSKKQATEVVKLLSVGRGVKTQRELVVKEAKGVLNLIRNRVSKMEGRIHKDAQTQRVIEWVVLQLEYPVLSDLFGSQILPLVLRLIDSSELSTKATGMRVLKHCTKQLMLTEKRFHGPLLLHQLSKAFSFHQLDIEVPLYESLLVLIPALMSDPDSGRANFMASLKDSKRGVKHQKLVNEVLDRAFKEIEWVGLSTHDMSLKRVRYYAEGLLPKLIPVLGDHCALYIRTLLPTLSRMGETDDTRVATGAIAALKAFIETVPERIPAHCNKLFETCTRIYIKNQPANRNSRKTNPEEERARQGVCEATCELLSVLRARCEQRFEKLMEEITKKITGLVAMKTAVERIRDASTTTTS